MVVRKPQIEVLLVVDLRSKAKQSRLKGQSLEFTLRVGLFRPLLRCEATG